DQRSSSPFRNVKKLLTPDCSPIQKQQTNKTNQNRKLQSIKNKQSRQPTLIRSIPRPAGYNHLSISTNSPMAMLFDSSPISSHFVREDSLPIKSGQTLSQYARQVLDSALKDLMECSM
ncbi:unnamed protein product, partial [Didymodactylos carnosus]